MKKRILSILVALCMVLTLLPSVAAAAEEVLPEENAVSAETSEQYFDFSIKPPAKRTYIVGESLDITGMHVYVTPAPQPGGIPMATEIYPGGYTCAPTTFDTAGTVTVTITYQNMTESFDVTVTESSEGPVIPGDAVNNGRAFSFNFIHAGDTEGYIDFNLENEKFNTRVPLGEDLWEFDFGTTGLHLDTTKGSNFPGFQPCEDNSGRVYVLIYLAADPGAVAQAGEITIRVKKEAIIGIQSDIVYKTSIIKAAPEPSDIQYVFGESNTPIGVAWNMTMTENTRQAESFAVNVYAESKDNLIYSHYDMANVNMPGILEISGNPQEMGTTSYTYFFQQGSWYPDILPPGDYPVVVVASIEGKSVVDNKTGFGPTWTKQDVVDDPVVEPPQDNPPAVDVPYFPDFVFDDTPTVMPTAPNRPTESVTPTEPEQPAEPEAPAGPETPAEPEQPAVPAPVFTDVAPAVWYSEAASYVSANGLMTGTGDGEFSPDANMTRAMLWTVLGRMDGADVEGAGNNWYAKAQSWIVGKGFSDGLNAGANITREELVTMLWRYAGSPDGAEDLSGFADSAGISGWAAQAMGWAVSAGLLKGDGGRLNPAGTATRAEVAAILMRFCETR